MNYQLIHGKALTVDQFVAIRPLFGPVGGHPENDWFYGKEFYFSPAGLFLGVYRDERHAS
jgi:hypothetical protein